MTLEEKQLEFEELFNTLGSWQERFQYLIDIGNELPPLAEHQKNKNNKIESCLSNTYFYTYVTDSIIHIEGWSNASIPSGFIMMLKNIFEGATIDELRDTDIRFHIETELIYNLTEQRKAALYEMIFRILKSFHI